MGAGDEARLVDGERAVGERAAQPESLDHGGQAGGRETRLLGRQQLAESVAQVREQAPLVDLLDAPERRHAARLRPEGEPGGDRLRVVLGVGEVGEDDGRSEEHTSELQSLMRISYAVFCLKK